MPGHVYDADKSVSVTVPLNSFPVEGGVVYKAHACKIAWTIDGST
jgi:hypothetical protein